MAKTYRLNPGARLINSLFRALTRLGLGASYRHILTVRGRKTGRPYSTPVDIIELDDQAWLVAGYGPANWVRNVRAAGEVTLSRGRHSHRFRVEETDGPAAVPVLRKYMSEIRVTRPYFDAAPDSPDADVATASGSANRTGCPSHSRSLPTRSAGAERQPSSYASSESTSTAFTARVASR